jgi:XTP/dITP diphosphohydrolase
MRLIIASGNQGKINEIKASLSKFDIVSYFDLVDSINIVEDGDSYEENAKIKAFAIYEYIYNIMKEDDFILSDDSGISIESLNGEPGIYSARYANKVIDGEEIIASDIDNVNKVIDNLKLKGLQSSKAFYTSALVLVNKKKEHKCFIGHMNGKVINTIVGDNGFGYDPIFVPDGFECTLGEISLNKKQKISHRNKSIFKMKEYLQTVIKGQINDY